MLGTTAREPVHPNQRRVRGKRMRPGVIPTPGGSPTAHSAGEPLDAKDRGIMAGCESQPAVRRRVTLAWATRPASRRGGTSTSDARSAAVFDRITAERSTGSLPPASIASRSAATSRGSPNPPATSRGGGRWHGRHPNASANMMVWSRPGPTETMTTGMPTAVLIRSRYARTGPGMSASRRACRSLGASSGSSHPGIAS